MDLSSLKTSYVILREIGRGGMGVVFQAWDRRLERNVALKILSISNGGSLASGGSDSSEAAVEQFLQEAKAVARLNHPNIVTLYDIGGSKGRYYLVMEYVEGYNLEMMQKQHKISQVPEEMVLNIGIQLCEALEYAHRQGIIHRDIKPANVLLNGEGNIKLMDFGIARMQRESGKKDADASMLGSVLYMAPEQLMNASSVDARADLYALGVTLFELLCGSRPFQTQNIADLIREIMLSPAPGFANFGVSTQTGLEAVILKALSKDPMDRYQTAAEMRQALLQTKDNPAPGPQHSFHSQVRVPGIRHCLSEDLSHAGENRMPARDELYQYVRSLLEAAA